MSAVTFIQFSYASIVVSKNDSSTNVVVTDSLTTINETTLSNALSEFKNLSHKEKMFRIKEAKAALKAYKVSKANGDADTNTLLLVLIAILLPPLAVFLHEKAINAKFWISLLLTLLFYLPGLIYALVVILG